MNSSSGSSAVSNTPASMNAASAGYRSRSATALIMAAQPVIHSSGLCPDAITAAMMSASVLARFLT
jgi:hypothetical protein